MQGSSSASHAQPSVTCHRCIDSAEPQPQSSVLTPKPPSTFTLHNVDRCRREMPRRPSDPPEMAGCRKSTRRAASITPTYETHITTTTTSSNRPRTVKGRKRRQKTRRPHPAHPPPPARTTHPPPPPMARPPRLRPPTHPRPHPLLPRLPPLDTIPLHTNPSE